MDEKGRSAVPMAVAPAAEGRIEVVKVGEVAKATTPVPVSLVREVASWAEVIDPVAVP
jgi:hypothetical protein